MTETTAPDEDAGRPGPKRRFLNWLLELCRSPSGRLFGGKKILVLVIPAGVLLISMWILSIMWGQEPDLFDVRTAARARASQNGQMVNDRLVAGYVVTSTLIDVASTLLDKPGGYLTNDKLPPTSLMDNIPNWEFGVLTQVRDFARAMRNDITRSQTQSIEDRDLSEAEPKLHFNNNSWLFPSTEAQYREGIALLNSYLRRLAGGNQADARFYPRADNLRDWLRTVEKRLGSLSQRLSASVGQARLDTDPTGAPSGQQPQAAAAEMIKTPWMQIDDVFYEARGTAWALIHLLEAVEIDFQDVLNDKNAVVSLRQIIRELEATQKTVWSPMVMNGSDFGLFANHSLVMSSYISRAHSAIMDLRNLLQQG